MRDWLKTQPDNLAFKDTTTIVKSPTIASVTENPNGNQNGQQLKINNMSTFSKFPLEGFFDIVCQVCAICTNKDTKFVLVWDGTLSK